MEEYISVHSNEKFQNITVCFQNEQDKVLAIGDKMYALNEMAYMNGYNWDAFFNYYLSKNHPELLEDLEPDPEAGSYFAHYPLSPESEIKANKFAEVIKYLIENEDVLYKIVEEEGNKIEWD